MELTAEQQQAVILEKAAIAWSNSPIDAVGGEVTKAGNDYSERLGETRKVFEDAYTAGYRQARQAQQDIAGTSHLSFGDALILNAAVGDLMAADVAQHKAADAMRRALSGLIEAGKKSSR